MSNDTGPDFQSASELPDGPEMLPSAGGEVLGEVGGGAAALAAGAVAAALDKPSKKPQGPIRWRMIIGVLVVWVGTGLGLYLFRDALIKGAVVSGGRSTFQSSVSLERALSGLSPAQTKVELEDLQIPDRADLTRNLIQADELSADVSPMDLLSGQVHVAKASAKGVRLNAVRATPAEPLPLPEEPPAPEATDDMGGLFGDEGALFQAFKSGSQPILDVLHALGLESVAYAEGLPGRIEEGQKAWQAKLEGHKQELAELQARGKELQPRVTEVARSIQQEWAQALTEKRQKLDQLEQALKKDPKAAGPNPATDIPQRVQTELASLDELKQRQEARAAEVRGELEKLQDDAARLKAELQSLDKDARQAQGELAAEVTKARTAGEHDKEKIRRWVDPSGEGAQELLQVLVGPRVASQVQSGRKWVSLLWRLLPPRKKKVPPATPREGVDVTFPPPPGAEQAARDALAMLLIDDLELQGDLALEQGLLRFEGHVLNLSDAPYLVGREVGFNLACSLGEGADALQLKVEGGLVPEGEKARLELSCQGVEVKGLVLRPGEPAVGDVFPRRVESAKLDLSLKIDSAPERFALAADVHLRELTFSAVPEGPSTVAAARAVHQLLAGVKELHLALELALPKGEKGSFSVKDLTQPSVLDEMRQAVRKAVEAEVEQATARYTAELDTYLAQQSGLAKTALDASTAGWSQGMGGLQAELDKATGGSSKPLDEALAGGDQAKKKLAEEAVPRLLKAATQGGLNLPKLPFGKD